MFIETFLYFWFPEHALLFSKHTIDSPCIYTPCYVSSDEKGIESAAGKTGQDIK
jgi:hypothetical protein